jgi:hypothetical protein
VGVWDAVTFITPRLFGLADRCSSSEAMFLALA